MMDIYLPHAGSGVAAPSSFGEEVQHITAERAGAAAGCSTGDLAEVSFQLLCTHMGHDRGSVLLCHITTDIW